MQHLIKNIAVFVALLALLVAECAPVEADAPVRPDASLLRVTLLGTGTPTPESSRAGPATLVEAGGQTLLFDVGRGAVVRLAQLAIPLSKIDAVFITHLHSDHVLGLPDLQLSMRMPADYGMRQRPLPLYGPTGTIGMARGLESAFALDIQARARSQKLDPAWATFEALEFARGATVFDRGGVRVTAFEVDHSPDVTPSFGYRVDHAGRSVVISGDTRFDPRLIEAARGADLLIHEVVSIPDEYVSRFPGMAMVLTKHTSPSQAGIIFDRVRPKLAVYYHLALIGGASLFDVVKETRRTYAGPLQIGEDLMTFEIGEGVAVYRRDAAKQTQQ